MLYKGKKNRGAFVKPNTDPNLLFSKSSKNISCLITMSRNGSKRYSSEHLSYIQNILNQPTNLREAYGPCWSSAIKEPWENSTKTEWYPTSLQNCRAYQTACATDQRLSPLSSRSSDRVAETSPVESRTRTPTPRWSTSKTLTPTLTLKNPCLAGTSAVPYWNLVSPLLKDAEHSPKTQPNKPLLEEKYSDWTKVDPAVLAKPHSADARSSKLPLQKSQYLERVKSAMHSALHPENPWKLLMEEQKKAAMTARYSLQKDNSTVHG